MVFFFIYLFYFSFLCFSLSFITHLRIFSIYSFILSFLYLFFSSPPPPPPPPPSSFPPLPPFVIKCFSLLLPPLLLLLPFIYSLSLLCFFIYIFSSVFLFLHRLFLSLAHYLFSIFSFILSSSFFPFLSLSLYYVFFITLFLVSPSFLSMSPLFIYFSSSSLFIINYPPFLCFFPFFPYSFLSIFTLSLSSLSLIILTLPHFLPFLHSTFLHCFSPPFLPHSFTHSSIPSLLFLHLFPPSPLLPSPFLHPPPFPFPPFLHPFLTLHPFPPPFTSARVRYRIFRFSVILVSLAFKEFNITEAWDALSLLFVLPPYLSYPCLPCPPPA